LQASKTIPPEYAKNIDVVINRKSDTEGANHIILLSFLTLRSYLNIVIAPIPTPAIVVKINKLKDMYSDISAIVIFV